MGGEAVEARVFKPFDSCRNASGFGKLAWGEGRRKNGRAAYAKEVGVRNPMGKRTSAPPLAIYFGNSPSANFLSRPAGPRFVR